MADAIETLLLSILGPALRCEWMVPTWEEALLTTVVFGGMLLSSGLWGKVSDTYGRKAELFICTVFTFYYGILSVFSPNMVWMLFLRFVVGFGIGGFPQLMTFYSEFLPSAARAPCIVLIMFFWAAGTCFIVLMAIIVMPSPGWRYLVLSAALPLVVCFCTFFWLPESPRFEIARGRPDRAMATLQRVARDNGKPMPRGKLVDITQTGAVERGRMSDIVGSQFRRTSVILWYLWTCIGFIYYGIILITTELFQLDNRCDNGDEPAQTSIKPDCRLECKSLTMENYYDLLVTSVAEFPGLLFTLLLTETIGRRFTLALEFFFFGIIVLLTNFCFERGLMTAILFLGRAISRGVFQAAYVYTPEVYPTTIRSLGLGLSTGMCRIGCIITPFVAQVLLRENVHVAMATYVAASLVAAVLSLLLPIETKGREMKETHLILPELPQMDVPPRMTDADSTR